MLASAGQSGIDWAAWGTWAAVVVALGIALRDVIRANIQRRVDSRILAARAIPLLATWKRYLLAVDAEINHPDDEIDMYTAQLAVGPSTRAELYRLTSAISVKGVDVLLEAWSRADSSLTGALATAAAHLEVFRLEGMRPAATPDGEHFRRAEEYMVRLRALLAKARAAVAVVENQCIPYQ